LPLGYLQGGAPWLAGIDAALNGMNRFTFLRSSCSEFEHLRSGSVTLRLDPPARIFSVALVNAGACAVLVEASHKDDVDDWVRPLSTYLAEM